MRSTRFFLPLVVAALALGACSDGSSVTGSGNGRLTVLLTDAPGDLDQAFVHITKIVLLRSAADSATNNAEGRIEITPDVTSFINLLDFTGGDVMTLVEAETVPEGAYSQMRVYIDDAYIVTEDGRVFATEGATLPQGVTADGTLRCPSCSQSGYKVLFTGGGLDIEGNSTVTIDFDADQSFGHQAGQSGQWIMHPVLRATATTIRLGLIKGTVSLASGLTLPTCGGAAVTLAQFKPFSVMNNDTTFGTTDATGAFRITALLPGTYALGFASELTFTNSDSLTFAATPSAATVNVAQGDSVTADYSITAATCH